MPLNRISEFFNRVMLSIVCRLLDGIEKRGLPQTEKTESFGMNSLVFQNGCEAFYLKNAKVSSDSTSTSDGNLVEVRWELG